VLLSPGARVGGADGACPQAYPLIKAPPADIVMADAASEADRLRRVIAAKSGVAVIPNNPSRARKYRLDRYFCAQRSLIECRFIRLKQFRRVATRYEKTARNYLAVITFAATILWSRELSWGVRSLEPIAESSRRSGDCHAVARWPATRALRPCYPSPRCC
jgi:transposase